jgi:hypothetical protein
MPNPLDVAFAVFRNDQARTLLADEIEKYGYGPNLTAARARTDSNSEKFWDSSLYNLWLGALQALSPAKATELPPVARTEPWGRRMLSTQLASWAELRHDTILYAKQSYSGEVACSFPDVYVDPYPAFYERLAKFADRGKSLVSPLDFGNEPYVRDGIVAFFTNLSTVAGKLGRIAERQRRRERPTKDDLDFVNQALVEKPVSGISCGGPLPRDIHGWYVDLFYDGEPLAFKPTIADVHTQPTDENGNMVGNVLHVGTGSPRLMVVDIDNSRRFVGLVSDYAEITVSHFLRLTDEDWTSMVAKKSPDDVAWMKDLVVR